MFQASAAFQFTSIYFQQDLANKTCFQCHIPAPNATFGFLMLPTPATVAHFTPAMEYFIALPRSSHRFSRVRCPTKRCTYPSQAPSLERLAKTAPGFQSRRCAETLMAQARAAKSMAETSSPPAQTSVAQENTYCVYANATEGVSPKARESM